MKKMSDAKTKKVKGGATVKTVKNNLVDGVDLFSDLVATLKKHGVKLDGSSDLEKTIRQRSGDKFKKAAKK